MFRQPSRTTVALAALLLPGAVLAQLPPQAAAEAERQIRSQRAAFNLAIANGDLAAIAAVLADNAQLVAGSSSEVTAGKAAQVALWAQDLQDKSRGIYVRTPQRVQISPLGPMAMATESGHWRGVDTKSAKDWASGTYFAKWRRFDGTWRIESETYMTTACGGTYCPKRR